MLDELDRLVADGITDAELEKARAQLRARFVFDIDGVTDIAHQLGYFETIGSWRDALTLGDRLGGTCNLCRGQRCRARSVCARRTGRLDGSSRRQVTCR